MAKRTPSEKKPRDDDKLPELSVAEQQLASIIAFSEDAIISRSLGGKILTWNQGAERLYGYQASEVIGKPISMLVPKDIPRDDLEITEKILRGERVEHYVTQRLRKDGSQVVVDLSVSPLKDARGKVVGVAAITRDITKQESIISRQREFVSIASHELRTPLTALTGYLSLAEGAEDDALVREFVRRAFKAAMRLTNLVEDLLEVARLEEDRTEFELMPIHPEPIVRDVVDELIRSIEKKKIDMSVRSTLAPRDLVTVDPVKFNQVVRNLVDNAIKYTPPRGKIRITMTESNGTIRIRVRDSGIGIEQKNLERIFDKFFREYTELSVAAGGTGLGLFITQQLVKRMGGALKVRSRRKVGTTMTLEFPRSSRTAVKAAGATMQKKK